MTALAIFGAALLLAGSIFGHAVLTSRQHAEPDPQPEPEQPFNLVPLAVLTPDDPRLPDGTASAIARAVDHYADVLIARRSGVDPDAVERLEQRMYDDLRDSLTAEQLARAVLAGLHGHAVERANHLTDQFRNLPTHSQES